ncbi:MAG TPA: ferredoxin--NADP reductase [Acidimicrobiales bacterium]|nr:ferredoxin--NADP reductase [Acidimicrobiales bacterium]
MTDHSPVLREHGYHELRVKDVVGETHDASSFVLEVPDELRATFHYRPGQFCTFRVHVDGDEQLRSYSMSSTPESDPDLTVTVKRVTGGLVSNWFLDHLGVGDVVALTKPAGVFCPQDAAERPILAFCGGSGITPVMSIIKHVLATTGRSVRLLYANRDRNSVIFDSGLAALTDCHPGRLEVRHHFDAGGGFLTADDIDAFVGPNADNADCYICGPGPFMDLVEPVLVDLGVAPDRIFIERFLVEPQEKDAAAIASDARTAANLPDEVTVILEGKKAVVKYQPGDTLLETARRGGLRPPFSCESGNCATCMAFLKAGSVTMRANNALTPEEVDEGWVLTCQSLPLGQTVTVEYEAM